MSPGADRILEALDKIPGLRPGRSALDTSTLEPRQADDFNMIELLPAAASDEVAHYKSVFEKLGTESEVRRRLSTQLKGLDEAMMDLLGLARPPKVDDACGKGTRSVGTRMRGVGQTQSYVSWLCEDASQAPSAPTSKVDNMAPAKTTRLRQCACGCGALLRSSTINADADKVNIPFCKSQLDTENSVGLGGKRVDSFQQRLAVERLSQARPSMQEEPDDVSTIEQRCQRPVDYDRLSKLAQPREENTFEKQQLKEEAAAARVAYVHRFQQSSAPRWAPKSLQASKSSPVVGYSSSSGPASGVGALSLAGLGVIGDSETNSSSCHFRSVPLRKPGTRRSSLRDASIPGLSHLIDRAELEKSLVWTSGKFESPRIFDGPSAKLRTVESQQQYTEDRLCQPLASRRQHPNTLAGLQSRLDELRNERKAREALQAIKAA